jgi:hypothetical protein
MKKVCGDVGSVKGRVGSVWGRVKRGEWFLVLIQPAVIDMTRDNSLLSYEYLKKYPYYKRTNLTDTVENICIENEIPSVNLFTTFEENTPDNLFFKGENNHWNDRGQDLAAQETARYFKRSQ